MSKHFPAAVLLAATIALAGCTPKKKTIEVTPGNDGQIHCSADGKKWNARADGQCYEADEPTDSTSAQPKTLVYEGHWLVADDGATAYFQCKDQRIVGGVRRLKGGYLVVFGDQDSTTAPPMSQQFLTEGAARMAADVYITQHNV